MVGKFPGAVLSPSPPQGAGAGCSCAHSLWAVLLERALELFMHMWSLRAMEGLFLGVSTPSFTGEMNHSTRRSSQRNSSLF